MVLLAGRGEITRSEADAVCGGLASTKKNTKVHRVVRESLGAYRAVLLVSLRLQGGECHTSHMADMSRRISLFAKIYRGSYLKEQEVALLLSRVSNAEP